MKIFEFDGLPHASGGGPFHIKPQALDIIRLPHASGGGPSLVLVGGGRLSGLPHASGGGPRLREFVG